MNTFIPDKKTIKMSFSKAASTYDTYSALQRDAAKDLLKQKDKNNFFHLNKGSFLVLDIGCGTGMLGGSFKERYPNITALGCDFSLPMLLKAKEKAQNRSIRFLTSDCDELPFKKSFFGSVISSLTYQWVPDIAHSFKEVWRVLKPGGLFLFSILGPRTLGELRKSHEKTEHVNGQNGRFAFMEFHKAESLSKNLKRAGFEVLSVKSALKKKNYKNLRDLLKTLKATGASPPIPNGNKSLARGLILRETAKNYQKYFPASNGTGISATYDIVYAAAKKIPDKNGY